MLTKEQGHELYLKVYELMREYLPDTPNFVLIFNNDGVVSSITTEPDVLPVLEIVRRDLLKQAAERN